MEPAAREQEGDRIAALLDEIAATAAPPAWTRVEELVQRLVSLYGAGLGNLLRHADAAGADGAKLRQSIEGDELLEGLLLLHGLHPTPAERRIAAPLDRIRPQLGRHAGGVELVRVDRRGVVTLRLTGACDGCDASEATMEATIRAAVEEAAPEIAGIEIEGARQALPVLP